MRYVVALLLSFGSAQAQTPEQVPVAEYQTQTGEKIYIKGRTPESPSVEDQAELDKLFYNQHLFNIGFTMGYLFAPDRTFDSVQKPGEKLEVTSNNYPALHLEVGIRPPWKVVNRLYVGGDLTISGEDSGGYQTASTPTSIRYGSLSNSYFGEYDAIIISKDSGTAISAGLFYGNAKAETRDAANNFAEDRRFHEKGAQFRFRSTFYENKSYGGSIYVLAKVSDKGVWSFYYGAIAQFGPRFKVTRFKQK